METEIIQNKYNQIVDWLQTYKESTPCNGVVLDLSSGKDSTVVAMLAKKVWGNNVLGILMPNGTQRDIDDSIDIAKTIGVDYRVVDINTIYNNRIRMIVLYAVAQSMGYHVIRTGNASEAFIGWTTKWGDSAYDLNPIGHLTCSEVIKLGKLLANEFQLDEKYIVKPPSDGLCGNTDEKTFEFTYATLDQFIDGNKIGIEEDVVNKIEAMHSASSHKRKLPITIQR